MWPSQSSDLNIIEPLWAVWKTSCAVDFRLTKILFELRTFLQFEWEHIPLKVAHDLYLSIARRMQAIIHAKKRTNELFFFILSSHVFTLICTSC